ncbi:MAG: hypothetical protein ACYC0Q_01455 [Eubacteriales bacterium]
MAGNKKDIRRVEVKGNRKENLNRVRGTRKFVDPEKGPENKN